MPIFDIYPNDLINAAAEELKKIPDIKPPAWVSYAKTGAHRERAPVDPEWWFKRVAAILRSIYTLGPIGVSKLRIKYGGKRRRGHKKPHFRKGSGSVIRKALQQLDKAGFTKFVEKGTHKGRIITPKGKSFLDKIAVKLSKAKPKPKIVKPKPEEKPKEKKKPEEKIPTVKELVKKTKERFEKGPVTAEQLLKEAKKAPKKKEKKKEEK